MRAAASAELDRYSIDAGYVRKLSEEKRTSLQQRLRKFVDSELLKDLAQLINLLSDAEDDKAQLHYVIIDRLDENWVDSAVRYRLIRALIEALRSMRAISSLKDVVALRSDLLEKVLQETSHAGFQVEKYEDYIVRVSWSPDELKQLLNKRIGQLYRRKYTKENVTFEDIFPRKVGKANTFSYILDRTLMRPRDLIMFANLCFQEALGKNTISERMIRHAELEYSESRLSALLDEWQGVFPAMRPSVEIMRNKNSAFLLSELLSTRTQESLLTLIHEDDRYTKDPMYDLVDRANRSGGDLYMERVVDVLLERLHLAGVIGVNTRSEAPYDWFQKTNKRLRAGSVSPQSKIQIHPMFHPALGVK